MQMQQSADSGGIFFFFFFFLLAGLQSSRGATAHAVCSGSLRRFTGVRLRRAGRFRSAGVSAAMAAEEAAVARAAKRDDVRRAGEDAKEDAVEDAKEDTGISIRCHSGKGNDMGSGCAVKVEKDESVSDVRRLMGGGGGLAPRLLVVRRSHQRPGDESSATGPDAAPLLILLRCGW
jgi:hypothetical protein